MNESKYWAASDINEIAGHILERKDNYLTFLENSTIMGELRDSFSLFYGNTAIDEMDNGKTIMTSNHYASLVRALHTMVTQQRPAFEARAVNSDYKTQSSVLLANGLIDYYMREKKLEDKLKEACLLALYLREGWITVEWDVNAGEVYAVNPESQSPVTTGDVKFSVYSILDVIRPTQGSCNWHIIRRSENKYDLAAKYPEVADEILNSNTPVQDRRRWTLSYIAETELESDDVEVLTLYHAKTPAMPAGRFVQVVGDTVLTDGPLPYNKPYIFKITAADAFQTAFGHSPAMDIMPLQDALDTCFSIALSNINSFGIGSLVSEKGTLQVNQLREGLMHLEHSKGSQPPQVLNLLQIPNEIFNFAEMLVKNAETISSVNSVARGNVPHQMSGTAMALVAQQAITFSSGLQQSYNSLIESTGTALVELLQTYAQVPMVAQIAGKTKKSYLKQFKSDDLKGISKVVVDSANAFTKTTAGKVEVANNLLNSGLIKTPEQYLQVVSTGTLEPMVEHDQAELMLIRQENEMLSEGQPVQALITDNHGLHVLEHSTVASDPLIRQDPNILQPLLAHIDEHIQLDATRPPQLSLMLKQQPAPPPQPMAPPGEPPPQDMFSAQVPEPAQPPPGAPQ